MLRLKGIFSSEDNGFSWWWFGVKVGVVCALILWWWLENRNKNLVGENVSKALDDQARSIPLPEEETSDETMIVSEPDDLTKIEGIGPKINTTLQEAGIQTFSQLAASKPETLKKILTNAGIRVAFPDTWPEQAALAAKGDWSELENLQSKFQGGRRVD